MITCLLTRLHPFWLLLHEAQHDSHLSLIIFWDNLSIARRESLSRGSPSCRLGEKLQVIFHYSVDYPPSSTIINYTNVTIEPIFKLFFVSSHFLIPSNQINHPFDSYLFESSSKYWANSWYKLDRVFIASASAELYLFQCFSLCEDEKLKKMVNQFRKAEKLV